MKTVALVAWIASAALAQEKQMTTFNFDSDTAGQPPKGLEFALTGKGRPGQWIVQAVDDAPSGKNVLAQTDGDDTDYRFPIAYTGPELKDLRLSVKCKPIAGKVDQGCGIVWRLKDKDNYYITRANALEDNVHLYHVINGRRVRFAGWNGKVASGVWHELATEMVGDHIQVFFDGKRVIDEHDGTFKDAGKFGVWTKADSIIQFDDLAATPK
jgi:hypothetical protein